MALGVGLNLALLGYFKYANFLVDNFNTAADAGWSVAPIVLPLAISFFTFQQIAFLVDVRRQRSETPNFLSYCLFVTFFPQLIAGPIVYHREIMPQILLAGFGRLRSQNLAVGLTIFVIGLFKKVVLAYNIAPYSTIVFDAAADGTTIGLLTAWQGALAYSAQIYFDFSGYSDMAIGLGRLFGIRLPLNFNSPYKAASIIDFWRRWHMTLSRFLRDYLYIPLGGGRSGAQRHGHRIRPHRPDRAHRLLLPGAGARRRRAGGMVGRGQRHDGFRDPAAARDRAARRAGERRG